ncbi:MAG TPA: hypothetical protein VIL18_02155 [Longimicrobiales bacterium]
MPHQLARFRGTRPDLVRVEIYPDLPLDSLGARPGDELDAGIFVFDALMEPAWRRPHQVHSTDEPLRLVYRFEVPAGRFTYGIEARQPGPDSVPQQFARAREHFAAEPFAGRLAISDLLLAHEIVPLRDPPARRGDLAIVARRGTTLAAGEPLVLYFEVYGLTADEDGFGRYRAELAVEDTARHGVFAGVIRGLRGLLGGETPEPRVRWERTTPLHGDLAIDYLSIQLTGAAPGEYVVRITLTDLATGEQAETIRGFRITSARGGGGRRRPGRGAGGPHPARGTGSPPATGLSHPCPCPRPGPSHRTSPGSDRSPDATSNTSVTHSSGSCTLALTRSAAVTPSYLKFSGKPTERSGTSTRISDSVNCGL